MSGMNILPVTLLSCSGIPRQEWRLVPSNGPNRITYLMTEAESPTETLCFSNWAIKMSNMCVNLSNTFVTILWIYHLPSGLVQSDNALGPYSLVS
jgi:hypothetical protein